MQKWSRLLCSCAALLKPTVAGLGKTGLLLFACTLVSLSAGAQFLEIGGSPNVVGSGARAMGMGGAFIAVADDATAASWNPGGLVQLERPEISVVYEYSLRSENYHSHVQPGLTGDNSISLNDLNYFSFAYPLPVPILDRNVVLSLNYQRRYDFERKLHYRLHLLDFPGGIFKYDDKADEYRQHGSLNALTPAVAVELTKKLSLGLAFNIYRDGIGENAWEEEFVRRANHFAGSVFVRHDFSRFKRTFRDFEGLNYTVGMLWSATDRLSFGAVYHTPFEASVTKHREDTTFYTGFASGAGSSTEHETWQVNFPSAYGLGAAYRFRGDKLTLSFDVTRREWNEFAATDDAGNKYSPITGRLKKDSDIDPVYTARLGLEYLFVDKSRLEQDYLPSLRCGVVYDPEPASHKPADFYGATFGVGLLVKDRINFDFAYEFRYGGEARHDAFSDQYGNSLGNAEVFQNRFLISTVVYF